MVTQTLEKEFRRTELGILPEDWTIKKLEQVSTEIGDGIHATPQYIRYSEINFINGNNLVNSSIEINSNTMCVSEEEYKKYKKRLGSQTILMSINGTIGNLAYFKNEKVVLGKSAAYINLDNSVSKKYIFYLLQTAGIKKFYENKLTGTTIRNLSLESLRNTPISFPPTKEEQTAIADVLSDTDDLIESLAKLITKKKLIKQAAMQELLTGKKRLPGFAINWETEKKYKTTEIGNIPEDWNLKKLGQLCLKDGLVRGPFGGSLKKEFFVDRGFKVYEQKNAIYKDIELGSYFIDNLRYAEMKRFEVLPGDFIISCSGTIGRIYQIPNSAPKGIINQALLKVRLDAAAVFDQYFFHYFSWDVFQEKIIDSTQGGAMKNLVGMDVFRNTLLLIPSTKEEQSAIANVLSDMDSEIETLEQKRDKYKQLKVGMMQQLLTGRIRLKCKN
jgi:type I restriction enzyme S subunit